MQDVMRCKKKRNKQHAKIIGRTPGRYTKEMAKARDDFDRSMREYDAAHNLKPVSQRPSRMKEVRGLEKQLVAEIEREGRPRVSKSASVVSVPRKRYTTPSYDSPGKALRAAQAATMELALNR